MMTGERRPLLDWAAARAIPILTAARQLNAALSNKRRQRCPFDDHSDDTPSFSFNPEKNLFHCFGCNRGGSVIEFVAAYRGTDKSDACRWLLGLPERTPTPRSSKSVRNAHADPCVNKADPEIYASLLALAPLERTGLAYLERRCITQITATHFGVGQVGDPANALRKLIMQFGEARVRESGIVGSSGRLCFPQGALLFGHLNDSSPHFLQSRRIDAGHPRWMGLLGIKKIPFNIDAIETSSEIYIVEGAIDVMSAHELGRTAIGLAGSSSPLSAEICSRLRRKTVYLLPDKDDAGTRIAEKTRDRLLRAGVRSTIQKLSAGKDLNDYLILQRGRNA